MADQPFDTIRNIISMTGITTRRVATNSAANPIFSLDWTFITSSPYLEKEALQKALQEAELKIKALNTLIDVAEEQLKIDIRKKSGAKQS